MTIIKKGTNAKNFTLKDQNGNAVRLSDFRGKKALLSFHPLGWTGVCAKQMKALEKNYLKFKKLNAVALGINIDSVPSKNAWAKALKIKNTRLLSDFWPHGKVAKLYGIFRAKDGFSERANIIIDEKGKVILAKVYPIAQLPNMEEIMRAIKIK